MLVVVLADTHLKGDVTSHLPPTLLDSLSGADLVLHAGDVVTRRALEELGAIAPMLAVLGNNDHELTGALPEQREIELEGVRVAMLHDSGNALGRAARLNRRFPEADLVVYGHSHVPLSERGIGGQWLFNPGSPTQRRAEPLRSFGRLELRDGELVRAEIERF